MDVRLVPETASAAAGSTVTLAFVMRPQPGWHGYWRNPGDAGAEPRVALASARRLARRAARNIRCRAAHRRRADELCVRARLCPARAGRACRRAPSPARPSRSTRGSTIWSAPTRSACPRRATVTVQVDHRRAGAPDPRVRRLAPRACRGRSASAARFATAGGRVRLAMPLPAATALAEPYFFPARPTRSLCGAAEHLAQRRHADRRDRGRAARRRAAGDRGRAPARPTAPASPSPPAAAPCPRRHADRARPRAAAGRGDPAGPCSARCSAG